MVAGQYLRAGYRSGVQVNHCFGLVDHVGRAVLLGADLGVRFIRVFPLLVAHFLGPFAVELAHRRSVRGIDAALLGQAFDILPVLFARVAVD